MGKEIYGIRDLVLYWDGRLWCRDVGLFWFNCLVIVECKINFYCIK